MRTLLSIFCAAGLFFAPATQAQSVFSATAAASAYEFIPGPRESLYAINEYSSIPGHAFDGYVYFDLSALAGSSVTSATLRLYTDANTAAGFMSGFGAPVPAQSAFTVTNANASWFDSLGTPNSNLNWSNRPLSGTAFSSRQNFGFVSNGSGGYNDYWIEIDVTPLVNSWLSSSIPNYGVRLSNLNESVFSAAAFRGRADTAFGPQLVVTAVPEPGTWILIGLGLAVFAGRYGRERLSRR